MVSMILSVPLAVIEIDVAPVSADWVAVAVVVGVRGVMMPISGLEAV
jgi:hypothetical protein